MRKKQRDKLAHHMADVGLHMIGKSVVDATFSEMCNPYVHAMAVVRATNGAELILKSLLVEHDPHLILTERSRTELRSQFSSFRKFLESGRTIGFFDLPTAIEQALGYSIPKLKQYYEFGRLRNRITHLYIPSVPLGDLILHFVFEVMEPIIDHFWTESFIEYATTYDEVTPEYLYERLAHLKVPFKSLE